MMKVPSLGCTVSIILYLLFWHVLHHQGFLFLFLERQFTSAFTTHATTLSLSMHHFLKSVFFSFPGNVDRGGKAVNRSVSRKSSYTTHFSPPTIFPHYLHPSR